MKTLLLCGLSLTALFLCVICASAQLQTEWTYHSATNSDPAAEMVPGGDFPFLVRGAEAAIPDDQPITIHLLTRQDFAGDMEEQVYVRWWDGYMAHWVMGSWVRNVILGEDSPLRFHDLPEGGEDRVTLDLWRVEIPSWVTQPGVNYYAIQLKGYQDGRTETRYLLRQAGGDFCGVNELGQVWSASEDFEGQDWRITITAGQ